MCSSKNTHVHKAHQRLSIDRHQHCMAEHSTNVWDLAHIKMLMWQRGHALMCMGLHTHTHTVGTHKHMQVVNQRIACHPPPPTVPPSLITSLIRSVSAEIWVDKQFGATCLMETRLMHSPAYKSYRLDPAGRARPPKRCCMKRCMKRQH